MAIYESGENYLETILLLKKRLGYVRAIDIANEFGYSKPSISRAMGILKKNGLITVSEDNQIELTPEGYESATKIYDRHEWLSKILKGIGVSPENADADACKMEHIISEETFGALKRIYKIWFEAYKESKE
ncbi:MAG: metal-dependent transcriptional regulator [Clostridiales bacterium]|jgi:Mn-dependent DtxR family transcriptional regulator|nr:metal-dependent transcriptional regulator [Clostridiales bacterium]MDR2749513.1 metal-dependent transcriptional regulator [Clostridiales bacterium]